MRGARRAARRAAAARRPTSRGASRSATRSCGVPSTRPPAEAGAWARMRARRPPWPRTAPRPPSGPTTSSSRRPAATRAAIDLLLEAGDGRRAAGARGGGALVRRRAAADRRGRPAGAPRHADRPRRALRSTGELERCSAALLEAIELVPADDAALRVRLTVGRRGLRELPWPPRARRAPAGRRPRRAARPAAPARPSRSCSTSPAAASSRFDIDAAARLGRRALEAARAIDDAAARRRRGGRCWPTAARCRADRRGAAERRRGRGDPRRARRRDARPPPRRHHAPGVGRVLHRALRGVDPPRRARRRVARATGQDQFVPLLAGAQALSSMMRGDLAAAGA